LRILAVGDVVGKSGCDFLRNKLCKLKERKCIDVAIVNGENSAHGNGITFESARHILSGGADIVTTGNHVFKRKESRDLLVKMPNVIRPANYPLGTTPGKWVCRYNIEDVEICVINLMGTVYMAGLRCPFETIDMVLEETSDCKIRIVDFHAEATAEKRAMGFYLDGRVSAVFGTHTHVQTSDETILGGGTGYITDVGMTGVIDSVLGVKKELIIKHHREKLPVKFEHAAGLCKMECVIFDVDKQNGLTTQVERLRITPSFC
jgi:metallophosphoesterase (TIGR00282 family)